MSNERETGTPAVPDTDTELTPREAWEPIMEWLGLERFDMDPCGHPSASVPALHVVCPPADGLAAKWHGTVWCNPPYSAPRPWLQRAAKHGRSVCLIKADTSTAIWRETIWPMSTAILFPFKRIAFVSPGSDRKTTAKWASAVVVFGLTVRPRCSWGRVVMGGP